MNSETQCRVGHTNERTSYVTLEVGDAQLTLSKVPESRGSARVELVYNGVRLVLGYDGADRVCSNFLAGLDPLGPHRMLASGTSRPVMGPDVFMFQSLASTSAIYAGYLADGTLRLLIQGSQQQRDLEVFADLLPSDREAWRELVIRWSDGQLD